MIRTLYLIGRILAGLGAASVVAVLVATGISFANVDNCSEPDCDDVAFEETSERALNSLSVSRCDRRGGGRADKRYLPEDLTFRRFRMPGVCALFARGA